MKNQNEKKMNDQKAVFHSGTKYRKPFLLIVSDTENAISDFTLTVQCAFPGEF